MARPFGTKDIKTAEELWGYFEAYKKKVKSNPRIIFDFVGKDGVEVERKLEVPLTIEGFECFGYDLGFTFEHYLNNKGGAYEDYCSICSRIKREIRQDQIAGGMVGQYNASITQRLNGLREQTDSKVDHSIKILSIDPLSDELDNKTE